jgi:hypothetical protein
VAVSDDAGFPRNGDPRQPKDKASYGVHVGTSLLPSARTPLPIGNPTPIASTDRTRSDPRGASRAGEGWPQSFPRPRLHSFVRVPRRSVLCRCAHTTATSAIRTLGSDLRREGRSPLPSRRTNTAGKVGRMPFPPSFAVRSWVRLKQLLARRRVRDGVRRLMRPPLGVSERAGRPLGLTAKRTPRWRRPLPYADVCGRAFELRPAGAVLPAPRSTLRRYRPVVPAPVWGARP